MIENHLKPILGSDFRYEKNSEQMYAPFKGQGNLQDAFLNAKRLAERFEGRQDYSNHNPCTVVYNWWRSYCN